MGRPSALNVAFLPAMFSDHLPLAPFSLDAADIPYYVALGL